MPGVTGRAPRPLMVSPSNHERRKGDAGHVPSRTILAYPATECYLPCEMAVHTGVSYFSGRTLRHVRSDLTDMVEHSCTYVVHCLTGTDLAYYRQTMADIVRATHEAGLEAWLDPWGLTGIFSGETFLRLPLQHPETWQVLSDGRRGPVAFPHHPGP